MLIAKTITLLPIPESGQRDYWDEDGPVPGFHVRVSSKGRRTFALMYRTHAGKKRRQTIGLVGVLSLADARDQAKAILADVTKGGDPQADKMKARRKSGTFAALAERFLSDGPALRPATRAGWERYVRIEIIPALGPKPPAEITRADLRAFVRAIAQRAPVSANRAFEVVRRIYSWAVAEEILDASPCVGLQRSMLDSGILAKEKPRQRVYAADELRALLLVVPGTELEDLVPLILHTAARSEEARSARWSDFDLATWVWTVPAERSKSGRAHPLPLSFGARRILERIRDRQAQAPGELHLFPARTREGYVDKPNKSTAAVSQASGVHLRLHDLRRTVATNLAEMGTLSDVVECVLGHSLPELQRTYQVYTPMREMRTALEAWSRRLDMIVSGAQQRAEVVPFSA